MKLTATCGIIGALAISAFPLTSGFVTKSIITSAAMYENLQFVYYLMAASVYFCMLGLSSLVCIFQKDLLDLKSLR